MSSFIKSLVVGYFRGFNVAPEGDTVLNAAPAIEGSGGMLPQILKHGGMYLLHFRHYLGEICSL